MGSEADFWRTPSESELEESKKRRQRSDEVSRIMSEYLLKGYRMLATYCPLCMGILMEDKQGRQFCIACDEVDKPSTTTAASDQTHQLEPFELPSWEPAALQARAELLAYERSLAQKIDKERNAGPTTFPVQAAPVLNEDRNAILAALNEAKSAIVGKLRSVTKLLAEEDDWAVCVVHASRIKAFAETITALSDAAKRQSS